MFESDHLQALTAVVRHGTFEAAARELNITPSAISQRIKALERQTGAVVVQRTKPSRATETGQVLMRLAGQLDLLNRDARAQLHIGSDDPFVMTLVVNADSVTTWFLPALADCKELPARFRLHIEDEATSTRLLRDGTAMAAVTADSHEVQGCQVTPLGDLGYRALATPSFAAEHDLPATSTPEGRRAFAAAPRIRFNAADRIQEQFLELLSADSRLTLAHEVPSSLGFLDCVRLGMGWGAVPSAQAKPFLDSGELLDVAPGARMSVPLFWQHWRVDSPSLDALTAAVISRARGALGAT